MARAFKINTTPIAVARSFALAFITGATAEIALPPQIEVPEEIKREIGEETLSAFESKCPTKKINTILVNVSSNPFCPTVKIVARSSFAPSKTTLICKMSLAYLLERALKSDERFKTPARIIPTIKL